MMTTPIEDSPAPHPCRHRRRRRRRQTAGSSRSGSANGSGNSGSTVSHTPRTACIFAGGMSMFFLLALHAPAGDSITFAEARLSGTAANAATSAAAAAAPTRSTSVGPLSLSSSYYLTEEHILSIQGFDPANPPPLPLPPLPLPLSQKDTSARGLQAQTSSSSGSDSGTPTEQAKCRPLQISEWINLLQTETNAEYDLTEEVAQMANVDPSLLLARAQLMWEDTTNFEWTRSLGASTSSGSSSSGGSSSTPAPFVVCLEQSVPRGGGIGGIGGIGGGGRIASGFRRRKIMRDAIRSAIGDVLDRVASNNNSNNNDNDNNDGSDRWVYRDTILRTLYNGDDMLCSYVLMDGVVAQELSFDGCIVQPMTMSMKLMPRTIDLLLDKARDCQEEIEREIHDDDNTRAGTSTTTRTSNTGNGGSDRDTVMGVGRNNNSNSNNNKNGRQLDVLVDNGDGNDDRQRRRSRRRRRKRRRRRRIQGTVLDLLLGDGDDDDKNGKDKDNDNGGSGNSILDGLPDCDALDLDRPSADIIMCPGSLSYNQLAALQGGDPSYLVASLISKKGDQSSSIPEQVYWTSSAAEPYRRMESSRSEYWKRALAEAGSERCDEVFNTRLQWSVRPGTDDTGDFAALRVVYDASTAETWESACVGTLIAGLAVRQDVCGLEISADLGTTNYNANWMVQSGVEGETPLTDIGLDGSGQVVGLSDTGIDVQNCYFYDADFDKPTEDLDTNGHRKIAQYRAYADDRDEELGHGTHVAAIIAGNRAPDGTFEEAGVANGIAPAAKIAFLDISSTVGKLDPPSDNDVLSTGRESINNRSPIARIHSMSWGSKNVFYYNNQARMFDNFMFAQDDFLAVVAAGNEGQGDKATSVGAPGNSKNVLSVGASHAFGDDLERGQLGPSYIASFSSRGPTTDGRIAPDVVAPGKYILSAAARPNEPGACDPLDGDVPQAGQNMEGLYSQAGSSMSAPLVAGAAALVRQYFEEGWHGDGTKGSGSYVNPSGALVKATIINGAQADIRGVDNGSRGITPVRPYDNSAGFGRVSLTDSLYVAGKTDAGFKFWDGERLFDGDPATTYEVTIDKSRGCDAMDLSVTLTWIEEGSPPGCTKCLLNDLDLYVTENGKSSIRYHPNGRSIKDHSNNVERVVIDGAKDGSSYTIHVEAYNLNSLSQKYALVATGCFGGEPSTLGKAQNVFLQDNTVQRQNDGGGNSDNTTRTIIIVCASVGGAILLCLGLACFRRYQQKRKMEKKKAKQKKKLHNKKTGEAAIPEMRRGRTG